MTLFCCVLTVYFVVQRAMMEYGQSSGMVNVDGTMMPDPSKHPELEAMVRKKGRMEGRKERKKGGGTSSKKYLEKTSRLVSCRD